MSPRAGESGPCATDSPATEVITGGTGVPVWGWDPRLIGGAGCWSDRICGDGGGVVGGAGGCSGSDGGAASGPNDLGVFICMYMYIYV